MDAKDAGKQPKKKTEDYFPGASSAWSNAWCMDTQSFTTQEDDGHADYHDQEEPETGWNKTRS